MAIHYRGHRYVQLRTALQAKKSPLPAVKNAQKVAKQYYDLAHETVVDTDESVASSLDEIEDAFASLYDEGREHMPMLVKQLGRVSEVLDRAATTMQPLADQADQLWTKVTKIKAQWEAKGANPKLIAELDKIGQLLFYGAA